MTWINEELVNSALLGAEVESADFISAYNELAQQYSPDIDFSDPANFAYYGRAERYYVDALAAIKDRFPYDGSLAERLNWYKNLPWLDRWLFDNVYPKSKGQIRFSSQGWGAAVGPLIGGDVGRPAVVEYIKFFGGPHAYSGQNGYDFTKSNVYDTSKDRTNNLRLGMGNTVEFGMTKTAALPQTKVEVVCDIWNGKTGANESRLLVTVTTFLAWWYFSCEYRTNGVGYTAVFTTLPYDTESHYYSIDFHTDGTALLYRDGNFLEAAGAPVGVMSPVDVDLVGVLGAFQGPTPTYPGLQLGDGKASFDLDEFRFWRGNRTDKQIFRNFNVNVGGGTNTDDANIPLGVYFKFNEGIIGNSTWDANVIDYSGRMSNGLWVGYCGGRLTTSAVQYEQDEPILYDNHPDYVSVVEEYQKIGQRFDSGRRTSVFSRTHGWMQEEDTAGELQNLTQIIGSYFDTLTMQSKGLSEMRFGSYDTVQNGNMPFGARLLSDSGIEVGSILEMTTALEEYFGRSDDVIFQEKVSQIRNMLYMHIYKNITAILKKKGTVDGLRNLLRCFGIDDDVVRLKAYVDGKTYILDDIKTRLVQRKKRYVSFAHADNHTGVVYGSSTLVDPEERSYIPASIVSDNVLLTPVTVECDVVFPVLDHTPAFTKSSIFGMHECDGTPFFPVPDIAQFQVYSERHPEREGWARFICEAPGLGITLTSDYFPGVYTNSHWAFAVRVRNMEDNPRPKAVVDNYQFEFFGVREQYGTYDLEYSLRQQFSLTAAIPAGLASLFLTAGKRLYAGAHRNQWFGVVFNESDVEVGHLRYWLDYLEDDVIRTHAFNPVVVGPNNPSEPGYMGQFYDGVYNYVPQIESLVFFWGFDQNTTLGGAPSAYIWDVQSGVLPETGHYEPWVEDIINYRYPALAESLFGPDDSAFKDRYFSVEQSELPYDAPEVGSVEIKENYEMERFVWSAVPSRVVYGLEKSVYGAISQEMVKFFSTLSNVGDLFGQGVDRYRPEYKRLNYAKHLFFDRVNNVVDVDKFYSYYRWIDSSVGYFLSNLIAASDTYRGLDDVIESHLLERNKYFSKFPFVKDLGPDAIETQVLGAGESMYPASGFAPSMLDPNRRSKNLYWWQHRAERSHPDLAVGPPAVTASREALREAAEYQREPVQELLYDPRIAATPYYAGRSTPTYQGRPYVLKSMTCCARISVTVEPDIHSGINFPPEKRLDVGFDDLRLHDGMPRFEDSAMTRPELTSKDSRDLLWDTRPDIRSGYGSSTGGAYGRAIRGYAKASADQIFPGSIILENDVLGPGGLVPQITNLQYDSYMEGGDEPIRSVSVNHGGRVMRRFKPVLPPTHPDYEPVPQSHMVTWNAPTKEWWVDRTTAAGPEFGLLTSKIIEDTIRPVSITNVKAEEVP